MTTGRATTIKTTFSVEDDDTGRFSFAKVVFFSFFLYLSRRIGRKIFIESVIYLFSVRSFVRFALAVVKRVDFLLLSRCENGTGELFWFAGCIIFPPGLDFSPVIYSTAVVFFVNVVFSAVGSVGCGVCVYLQSFIALLGNFPIWLHLCLVCVCVCGCR